MYIIYCLYVFIFVCLVVFTKICGIIYFKRNVKLEQHVRKNPVKTLIILGSGGHTAEMLRILAHLNFQNYTPRVYVHAQTDTVSEMKVKKIEGSDKDYKILKVYRSREVRQSYITSIYSTIYATFDSIPLLWRERPELILCNGPGTCVPICIIMCENISIIDITPWVSLLEDLQNHLPNDIKRHLLPIAKTIKMSLDQNIELSKKWVATSLLLLEACLDRTWEKLNSGYWKDVPMQYRYSYSLCTIIKAVLVEFEHKNNPTGCTMKQVVLKNIVKQIDKGILLGAPLPSMPTLLTTIASKTNDYYATQTETNLKELIINSESFSEIILPGFLKLKEYEEPSMESFYRDCFLPKSPAVLKHCINHWKALTLWKDLDYLNRVAGIRTVPIELGSRYTEEDWSQHLVNFSEFVQKHISTKSEKIGYLAQHQLFEQVPELKDDFTIPDYCSFSDNEEPEQPDINVWFGPAGTVSPLHFDPKNNFLSQVFGYKRVILYHPGDSENLYPYNTRLLDNTAQVDPMNPDYQKWPNFCKAKGMMCYLKPGEMLYIPPKWWHHVTALTPSFSISFWWN